MKRIILTACSVLLLCSILFNISGCLTVSAIDLMDGITPNSPVLVDGADHSSIEVTDFAVRLLQATDGGANTFISPMSVMLALAMTANGAAGDTKTEMEQVLGMGVDRLNEYLYGYITSLPESEKCKLAVANSIWFIDDEKLTVNNSFLQKNADYYGAEIYKAPFDNRTLWDINSWVRRETNGMIPKILDIIPAEAIMYLINTIAFEGEWEEIYKKQQVRDGIFTSADGTRRTVDFMYSTESRYISDDMASGFMKYYDGGKYAFVGILPNEDVSLDDYLDSLSGDRLNDLLSSARWSAVRAAIPRFKTEYEIEMSGILSEMGMPTAFNESLADFSVLGEYEGLNIFIGNVIHKTYIEVAERGTKAGAVTVVEMDKNAAMQPDEPKTVYLDRPFIYMIIDAENNLPLFVGDMRDVK